MKKNKARDPWGMKNELFRPENAGEDLINSLLKLMNGIKSNLIIPEFLIYGNITSLYKLKGSRQDLENDRGIFNLVIIGAILDKLIYQDTFQDIDSMMSDSNVGARKKRNIRDHLFVVNGIINNVKNGKGQDSVEIEILVK